MGPSRRVFLLFTQREGCGGDGVNKDPSNLFVKQNRKLFPTSLDSGPFFYNSSSIGRLYEGYFYLRSLSPLFLALLPLLSLIGHSMDG